MHSRSTEIVAAVRACVGTRTRVQGREPGLALDCAGVALEAARGAGVAPAQAGRDYSLRADNGGRLRAALVATGCLPVDHGAPGDIAEIDVAPGQRHLAVLCGAAAVHAHFGVGKVVEAPLPEDWTIIACWRLPEEN